MQLGLYLGSKEDYKKFLDKKGDLLLKDVFVAFEEHREPFYHDGFDFGILPARFVEDTGYSGEPDEKFIANMVLGTKFDILKTEDEVLGIKKEEPSKFADDGRTISLGVDADEFSFETEIKLHKDIVEMFRDKTATKVHDDVVDALLYSVYGYGTPCEKGKHDIPKPEEIRVKHIAGGDAINPDHYANGCSIECIDAMVLIFGEEETYYWCLQTAFKYIWRYKNKNGREDLCKAKWYIDWCENNNNVATYVTYKLDSIKSLWELCMKKEGWLE